MQIWERPSEESASIRMNLLQVCSQSQTGAAANTAGAPGHLSGFTRDHPSNPNTSMALTLTAHTLREQLNVCNVGTMALSTRYDTHLVGTQNWLANLLMIGSLPGDLTRGFIGQQQLSLNLSPLGTQQAHVKLDQLNARVCQVL